MKKSFKLLSLVLSALTVMSASSAAFATPINIENPTCKKVLKYGLIGAGATAATLLTAAGAYKLFGSKTAEVEIEINEDEGFEQIENCRDTVTKIIVNVETIPENTFKDCKNLREIDLRGVKFIKNDAFENCSNLTTVKNTFKLEYIGGYAFLKCEKLKEIDLCNVKIISHNAFQHCSNLTTVKNTSKVEFIDGFAFSGCPLSSEIDLSSLKYIDTITRFSFKLPEYKIKMPKKYFLTIGTTPYATIDGNKIIYDQWFTDYMNSVK